MSGKKFLTLTGDFIEEYEISSSSRRWRPSATRRCGLPGQEGGRHPEDLAPPFRRRPTYTEKLGHNDILNKTFAEVEPADYDAVYVAGGRGPEYIRIDKRVQAMIRHFHEADKPIFTICHGVRCRWPCRRQSAARRSRRCNIASPRCRRTAASISTSRRPARMSTASSSRPRAGRASPPSCANA